MIIVNYNTRDLVSDCIDSIIKNTRDVSFEIIVVDNDSKDGSVDHILNLFPQVRIFPLNENIGFGKANNIGVKHAIGDFIFFLNSDTVLLNDAISILANYLKINSSVGLCGGQLYDKNRKPTVSYLEYPNFCSLLSMIIMGKISNKILPIYPTKKSFAISGADMMLRRSFIDRFGAFDPDFFMYYEDLELSYRVQRNGLKIHLVPEAHILHFHDMSPKIKGDQISDLDLCTIQSRYFYIGKVKGLFVMNILLFLHLMKSKVAIFYYLIHKNRLKVVNWMKIKQSLYEVRHIIKKKK